MGSDVRHPKTKRMAMVDLFRLDPEVCLAIALDVGRDGWYCDPCFSCSVQDIHGTWYGSYQPLNYEKLQGREYQLWFPDGKVGIEWLDRVYDPKLHVQLPFTFFKPPSRSDPIRCVMTAK